MNALDEEYILRFQGEQLPPEYRCECCGNPVWTCMCTEEQRQQDFISRGGRISEFIVNDGKSEEVIGEVWENEASDELAAAIETNAMAAYPKSVFPKYEFYWRDVKRKEVKV